MADLLIGVDIGTQGVKATLYQADGQLLAEAFKPSNLYQPDSVTVEEDPEEQLKNACGAIRQCLKKAKASGSDVAAAAFAGQMAGVIGVGEDGRNVTPYDSWLDQRCAPQIETMQRMAGPEIIRKTGYPPSFNHGPKILRWKQAFKKEYRRIATFVQPGGYVAMRLCGLSGAEAFIDKTYLHFSGFANNPKARWDPKLCERFEIDPAKLPNIVDPDAIVGEVTPEMARRCGLRAGTPVAAGCGDTAASFLSCGATRVGICVDVAGTASVFAATTADFRPDRRHQTLGCGQAATPGLWHPYAYINGGGMNLEWFRRELANRGRTTGAGRLDFETLNQLAGQIEPNGEEPIFVPHLGGRVCPGQPHLRGAWINLNWSHTLGHLYRATLEGVALEYALYHQILMQMYPELKLREIRITGGGEKSEVWNRIKADALGVPVVQVDRSGGAPMGAALVAGRAVGLLKSLPASAERWIAKGRRFAPDRKRRAYYDKRLERYQSLLEFLNESAS